MSHTSKHRSSQHRSLKRPLKKRTRTAVVGIVALSLSGAAYSAHASFGRAQGESKSDPTIALSTLGGKDADAGKRASTGAKPAIGWPTRTWPSWPYPTRPTPTRPTSTPSPTTPTKPTPTRPTTPTPTTPSPTTPTTPTPTTPTTPTTPPSGAQFPGHIPGQFYLGMSCGTACPQKEGDLARDYGVHRQFKNWGNWSGLAKDVQDDAANGRLPWISVKGPSGGGPAGWRAVAAGTYDADIRALATVLKANDDRPIVLTFNHEPSNDGTEADGAAFASAYVRFHDVLAQAGALNNVADAPIFGDWLFNPRNKPQDPANWLTNAVLQRSSFLGIDLYENSSAETYADRLPRIIDWMAARGFPNKMIGIGETGSTDQYAGSTAVKWMNDSLNWASAHTDKIAMVSYFNSMVNSRSGVYWPLDESTAKMSTFRTWLASNKTID